MPTTATSLLQRLNQHRAWVNQNLLEAATALDEQSLHRNFAIGQGTVWKSLCHMYAAEYVWLETMSGNEDACCTGDVRGKIPGNQLGEGAMRSLAELHDKWSTQEQRWQAYVAGLTAESLDEPVYRISSAVSPGQRLEARRADAIHHVCLHAHYTAAQVINMLRQLGIEKLPATMMIQLVRQERTK